MSAPPPVSDRAGVLCAGSVIVDFAKIVDRYPVREQLAVIEQISTSTGGPGLNMAVDLRMLGATWPVAIAGAVGADESGAFVLSECDRLSIDRSALRTVPGHATSFTDAMVEARGGRRTFFHHRGANDRFDGADIDVSASSARLLHVGSPGIHAAMDRPVGETGNGWSALLVRARAAGLRTNMELVGIEAARLRELSLPCLPHLDSLIINDVEAAAVTGRELAAASPDGAAADWATMEATVLDLIGLGVAQVAVVHFPDGCVAADASGRTWRQTSVRVPEPEVRNTTGAGDAFAAGVLFGLHEEWTIERCLRLGVAAAAMSIRDASTSAGVLPVADCLAAAERYGHHDA